MVGSHEIPCRGLRVLGGSSDTRSPFWLSGTVKQLQFSPMRGSPGERLGKLPQVDTVPALKLRLPYSMLLCVMLSAEANNPPIGGFEPGAPIGAPANMCALDRHRAATRY